MKSVDGQVQMYYKVIKCWNIRAVMGSLGQHPPECSQQRNPPQQTNQSCCIGTPMPGVHFVSGYLSSDLPKALSACHILHTSVLSSSVNTQVWLALEEKSIPYDTVLINLQDKPEWFKTMVPTQLVPAAKINGKLVYESYDIMMVSCCRACA